MDLCGSPNSSIANTGFITFLSTPNRGSDVLAGPNQPLFDEHGPCLALGQKICAQISPNNRSLSDLYTQFRIFSTEIPLPCYSEEEKTRVKFHDYGPDSPPKWEYLVTKSSSQLSQYAQWNGFDDGFDDVLATEHHWMAIWIGLGEYYDSLLGRLKQLLCPYELQLFQTIESCKMIS